jgi:transcriptional regulator with XRE-family HTH domain
MVTGHPPKRRLHLFIKEHMDDKDISDEKMAKEIGTNRETIWRRRTEQHRLNPQKIAEIAGVLGITPEELHRPPGVKSIDALLKDADKDTWDMAFDIVERAIRRR